MAGDLQWKLRLCGEAEGLGSPPPTGGASPSPVVDRVRACEEPEEEVKVEEGERDSGATIPVPAIFVFGGMDVSGNLHGDSFIFVPSSDL